MFSCAKLPAGQFSFVTVYLSRDLCELSLANAVDVWFLVFSLQVKAIHVHNELFSVENGFLTPTFKTKRAIVAKAFEEKFQELYEEVDKRLEFRRLTSFEIQQVVWMEQWSFCMHGSKRNHQHQYKLTEHVSQTFQNCGSLKLVAEARKLRISIQLSVVYSSDIRKALRLQREHPDVMT